MFHARFPVRRQWPKTARVFLSLFVLFLGCLRTVRGELTWAQKTADLAADAGTEVLEARFKFTNTGSTPVDIRQVESSCGCTTAELTQRHYEPSASGEIVARYTVGGHMGLQKKTLAVSSSDRPDTTTLTLVVHIPEIAHLEPAFVTWAHGETNKPKLITLEMLQNIALKDITVQSSNSEITAELRPLVAARRYQLVVTPSQTSQFLHAILTIQCQFGDRVQMFRTYATVQPPLSRQ